MPTPDKLSYKGSAWLDHAEVQLEEAEYAVLDYVDNYPQSGWTWVLEDAEGRTLTVEAERVQAYEHDQSGCTGCAWFDHGEYAYKDEPGRWDGYCRHGVYVGGCGADYMCGACESGE